mmetsp:Transcript_69699/g.145338  ORF Transcript_69699/g.145338 Transcript_69699/m.145338 type:complete len:82 (+) Transcript_69699:70-315(+)
MRECPLTCSMRGSAHCLAAWEGCSFTLPTALERYKKAFPASYGTKATTPQPRSATQCTTSESESGPRNSSKVKEISSGSRP